MSLKHKFVPFIMATRGFIGKFSTREYFILSGNTTNTTPRKVIFDKQQGPYLVTNLYQPDHADFRYGVNVEITIDGELLTPNIPFPEDVNIADGKMIWAAETLKITYAADRQGFGGSLDLSVTRFKYKVGE